MQLGCLFKLNTAGPQGRKEAVERDSKEADNPGGMGSGPEILGVIMCASKDMHPLDSDLFRSGTCKVYGWILHAAWMSLQTQHRRAAGPKGGSGERLKRS